MKYFLGTLFLVIFLLLNTTIKVLAGDESFTSQISVVDSPYQLLLNEEQNKLYSLSLDKGNLTVIDITTSKIQKIIPFEGSCRYITLSKKNSNLYLFSILDANKGNINIIDGKTDTVFQTIPVLAGERFLRNSVKPIVINETTNKVYAVNGKNQIIVIDENNNTTTVNVGINPVSLEVDELTNKIYVANFDSSEITVIDGNANIILSVIPVGKEPINIAVNNANKKVYVITRDLNKTVTIIDTLNNNQAKTIGLNILPNDILIDEVRNKIYLSSFNTKIVIIDGLDDKTTELTVGDSPFAIALNKTNNKLYTLNQFAQTLAIVDLNKNNEITTLSLGLRFTDFLISSKTNKLYISSGNFDFEARLITIIETDNIVSNEITLLPFVGDFLIDQLNNKLYANRSDRLLAIDLNDNNKISELVNLSGKLALNKATQKLYVVNSNSVSVLDLLSNKIIANIKINTEFFSPSVFIRINENTNQIFILASDLNDNNLATNKSFIAIIDGKNDTLLSKTNLNNQVRSFEVNLLTNKIYIVNRSGEITVVDGNSNKIIGSIKLNKNPGVIAINSRTNRIYIATPNKGTISVINGKNDSLIAKIFVGGRPMTLSVNENTNQLYSVENREVLACIDGNTNQITDRIKLGGNIVHLSLNKATNNIYAIDNISSVGKVIVIDGIKKTILLTSKLGCVPSEAKINEITGKAYVINWLSSTLSEIVLPNN